MVIEKISIDEAIQEIRNASDSEVRFGDTENHYDEVMKRVLAFKMAIDVLQQYKKESEE